MAVEPTYPGVYVQEAPSSSHVIPGTTTSDTAFVDVFERGPANCPQKVTNFGAFSGIFGGLNRESRASYGIYQFFQNGGETAWVVRITNPKIDVSASCKLRGFTLEARGPGAWGNFLEAAVQPSSTDGLIDLVVRETSSGTGTNPKELIVNSEVYRGLSLDDAEANYVGDVLSRQSQLVAVTPGSVKQTSGGGAGTPVTSQDSILIPNNIGNPGLQNYTKFAGGTATLAIDSAAALGSQGDPARDIPATGMYSLDTIAPSVFNLMCIPAMAGFTENEWLTAFDRVFNFCEKQQAFLIADFPAAAVGATDAVGQGQDITKWFEGPPSISAQTSHGAIYFPRLVIPDPNPPAKSAPMPTEASGTIAGVYARTDAARGVWKAPAGQQASLRGVLEPVVSVNDEISGNLNPLGINCIRTFPVYGTLSWGARTIDGADLLDSPWKYINVRRLALYIEQSLQQGTTWAVFEPNNEPLWSSLRLSVGSFMDELYKQGAFAGTSAKSGYFVDCGPNTTTPADQVAGIVNIDVGFAPLYPAEFVVITISQPTHQ